MFLICLFLMCKRIDRELKFLLWFLAYFSEAQSIYDAIGCIVTLSFYVYGSLQSVYFQCLYFHNDFTFFIF